MSIACRSARAVIVANTLLVLMLAAGCSKSPDAQRGELDTSKPTDFGYQVSPKTTRLIEGERVYTTYCVGCHGPRGTGDGVAARFLYPAPRNFQKAEFKFSSARFGQLPSDDDLYRSISQGLRGSSMPAWRHLGDERIRAVIEYIKTFSEAWKAGPSPQIPFVTDPYAEDPDSKRAVARGEVAYHGYFACWNCHPAYVAEAKISEDLVAMGGAAREAFRPNLNRAAVKTDSEEKTIFAPDFLRDPVKSGTSVRDLYRTIAGGITGTAMPTWIDTVAHPQLNAKGETIVSAEDLWAVAYYVQNLIKQRHVKFPADHVVVRDDRAMTFGAKSMEYVAKVPKQAGETFEEE